MSETDVTAETASEPQPENECPDGMVKDPETGECVPKADADVAGAAAAGAAEKGLFPAVRATIQEALDKTVEEMEQKMVNMMKAELAKIQKEFAVGLRKELGLSADPTVTKTELEKAIRKAVLEIKPENGKKTPAGPALQKGTPEPTRPGDQFKNYGAN